MADRYLMNDCNTHYSCCHNSYNVSRMSHSRDEKLEQVTVSQLLAEQAPQRVWLRRLLRRAPAANS